MSQVTRLSGAILARDEDNFFLVGDFKEPCDFAAAGFADPGERSPVENPVTKLMAISKEKAAQLFTANNGAAVLELSLTGNELGAKLSRSLLIKRNASVSERLWNLILDTAGKNENGNVNARFLDDLPDGIWDIVRDQVLRCS